MQDITYLLQYCNPVILGLCLCVGYALKYAKVFEKFGNQYIPITMMFLGCIISIVINIGNVNAEVILGGMISGLASTGLYEMLRNLLDFDGKKKEEN